MEEKNNINKYTKKNIVFTIIGTFLICFIIFCLFYKFYLSNLVVETTKLEKDVTITETGIADSVEKVYDSVVVVENYLNGKLYATGTGFVYKIDNDNGYLLTNAHVIENATSVKVVFTNNNNVDAEIVGSDDYSDVAVLKVPFKDIISVAEIGSSFSSRVGDTTFTVGAPVDASTYSWTVTRGIISGKDRKVSVAANVAQTSYIMDVLQTDAAINSGNSGGPLCNSNGEVIGITNMKLASADVEGMGFAIPIETAISYANKFVNGETVERPYIGISIYDIKSTNLNSTSGVYIAKVEIGSPAEKAEIQTGDIITKINDIDVTNQTYFKYELYKYSPGDTITLTIIRNDSIKDIKITLESNNN